MNQNFNLFPAVPVLAGIRRVLAVVTSICVMFALAACQPSPEERLERAEEYSASGDYAAAVVELKSLLQQDPGNLPGRLLLARASYQQGEFAAAQDEYVKVLEQGGDNAEAWTGLGRALLGQNLAPDAMERVVPHLDASDPSQALLHADILRALGAMDEAKPLYESLQDSGEFALPARVGLAVIAASSGDMETADAMIQATTSEYPSSSLAWRTWAMLRASDGRHAEAVDAFERAIASEDKEVTAADRFNTRVGHVASLIETGRLEDAEAAIGAMPRQFARHPVMLLFRGRIALNASNYEQAQDFLQQYLTMVPEDGQASMLLGVAHFSQNQLHQAEMYLAQATRQQVGGEMARRLLAETQLRLNKPGNALELLQETSSELETDPVVLALIGQARLGLGNLDEAVSSFEKAAASGSADPRVNLTVASGLLNAGQVSQALRIIAGTEVPDEMRPERDRLLVTAHLRDNNPQQAVVVTDGFLELYPDDANYLALAGVAQSVAGNADAARARFTRSLEVEPTNFTALWSMSVLDLQDGNAESAEGHLVRLLQVQPAYTPALAALVSVLDQAGRSEEQWAYLDAAQAEPDAPAELVVFHVRLAIAAEQLDRAEDALSRGIDRYGEDNGTMLYARSLVELSKGNLESGMSALASAAARNPDNADIQFEMASLALRSGDSAEALKSIRRYRSLRPDAVRGIALEVEAELRRGSPDEARRKLMQFLQENPGQTGFDLMRGSIELADGDGPLAAEYLEKAVARRQDWQSTILLAQAYNLFDGARALTLVKSWIDDNPEDARARLAYGQILQAQGDNSAAIAEYERILELNENDVIALNNLAWEYAEAGRPEARELAERAYRLAPENSAVGDTLGWIMYQEGDFDRAVELLRAASRRSPGNGEIQYHLAAALAKSGNIDAARPILDRLLSTSSDFPSRNDAEALAESL